MKTGFEKTFEKPIAKAFQQKKSKSKGKKAPLCKTEICYFNY
jgi:hypothetical protein